MKKRKGEKGGREKRGEEKREQGKGREKEGERKREGKREKERKKKREREGGGGEAHTANTSGGYSPHAPRLSGL